MTKRLAVGLTVFYLADFVRRYTTTIRPLTQPAADQSVLCKRAVRNTFCQLTCSWYDNALCQAMIVFSFDQLIRISRELTLRNTEDTVRPPCFLFYVCSTYNNINARSSSYMDGVFTALDGRRISFISASFSFQTTAAVIREYAR